MKITHLQLVNFKRFTDLQLSNIPQEAKLVLLIGSNGSGKSSVFDAFEYFNTLNRGHEHKKDYYKKNKAEPIKLLFFDERNIGYQLPGNPPQLDPSSFYGRTSFRQVPQLSRKSLQQKPVNIFLDEDRPRQFIHRDDRFENDIDSVIENFLLEIFRSNNSKDLILSKYVDIFNQAFERIFGPENGTLLRLIEIIPPLEGKAAQINFTKGQSEIHYDFLSAGEKEIFNILLNLFNRRGVYTDTIYFFDELDLHLNTAIQFAFLKEIVENWIPADSQLWTATHSLGFIEYAKQSDLAVILDFDNYDFDYPRTITPMSKDRMDIYEIAVPRSILFEMMRDKRLVVCENQNDEYYNLLGLPDTVFIGVKDARDVFLHVKREPRYFSIRDRDFLSDSEIERIQHKFPNHRILRFYDFENYLYHPDNIAEIAPKAFDTDAYKEEIIRQKNERIRYILPTLISSRQSYEEFKTDEKLRDKTTDAIVDDFTSDEFDRFYKYYDMKSEFNKSFLEAFNLLKSDLASTEWFNSRIAEILG